MADPRATGERETILLRVFWMLLYLLVWQAAQMLLGVLVAVQLVYRLIYGAPNGRMMSAGDSLSQFLAQIGRFGAFHTEQKPWPFADWPAPRPPEGAPPHRPPPAAQPAAGEAPKP
ncbi:DUF4389 domain-containing protein [Pseudomonas typographi]|uniref:DUF4389 domain-containing protein n=1 Tax=Pseudomonas typographi TaxID=2715964 RepID=A0ABR7Z3M2_9PSED|nr:DUF4389 domain-containing protein [Pseudomonas typographi]MBD1552008.1 DUF4389 domain-containing protein [Pseudomonas typographi]MBD1586571.1 DUF4389 domain-containing protein [Pseudomonas typographi]MBD1600073.1 DUF4389 domain-containing protein [Pseudomonas typographi]